MTSLILVPTRELAIQIQHQMSRLVSGQGKNTKRHVLAMYSGVDDNEIVKSFTRRRPHVLIGTPGRTLGRFHLLI